MKKLIVLFFFTFAFLSIPLLNINNSANFFYREITYKKISNSLYGDDKKETLYNVFEYVYENVDGRSDNIKLPVLDENSYIDAIRGFGFCDQQAFYFMNILHKMGFKTRLRDVQAHTYSEIFLKNKWIISDPYLGLMFLDNKNELLTLDEVQINKNFRDYFDFIDLNEDIYNKKYFKKLFIPNDIRWQNGISPIFTNYRSYDYSRILLEKYSDLLFTLFGKYYYNIYQDTYLKLHLDTSLQNSFESWKFPNNYIEADDKKEYESFKNFFIARNYDLSNRPEKAKIYYEKSIGYSEQSFWSDESIYYLGKLLFNSKKYDLSISLLTKLQENYPRYSKVNYYLGLNYLNLNNKSMAKSFFDKSTYLYSKIKLREIL